VRWFCNRYGGQGINKGWGGNHVQSGLAAGSCKLSFVEMLDIRKLGTSPLTTADVARISHDYGISPSATKLLVGHECCASSSILKSQAEFESMLSRLSPAARETELLILRNLSHDTVFPRSVRVRLLADAKYRSENRLSSQRRQDQTQTRY